MFEITYNKDSEVIEALIEYIPENSDFHASYNYEEDSLNFRRKKTPGELFTSRDFTHSLYFRGGVLFLDDYDVLFSSLYGFEDLKGYDEEEINYHHPNAPIVKANMLEMMTLLKETKITWQPSEEDISEAEKDGYDLTGFSISEQAVEPDLMTCYGFGGDLHWLECLEALVLPLLPPKFYFEFNPDNPLEVFITNHFTNTVLVLTHPMHVGEETRPTVRQGEQTFLWFKNASLSLKYLSRLYDLFHVIERSTQDEINKRYRSLVRKED